MTTFTDLIAHGNAWLFLPSAIVLGALHGLEPGHSKTMMAAFIIAVRGTVRQAALLGLCATFSHTLVVWAVALGGTYLWRDVGSEQVEPYLQMASAAIMLLMAGWMIRRIRREAAADLHHHEHHHDHDHHHDHPHSHDHDHDHAHGHHHHDHHHGDAHAAAHARAIEKHFAGRHVTTGQIILFGLTSGLIPCPGAITVLLLCLQLKKLVLGAVLVLCFSLGLAVTMVAAGAMAALSARHLSSKWNGFDTLMHRAPYISAWVISLIAVYLGLHGWLALHP